MSFILFQNTDLSRAVPILDFAVTEWESTGSGLYTEIDSVNDASYISSPLKRLRMQTRFKMSEITAPTGIVTLYIRMKI